MEDNTEPSIDSVTPSAPLRERLALAIATPGSRAAILNAENEKTGTTSIRNAVESDLPFFVEGHEDILIADLDCPYANIDADFMAFWIESAGGYPVITRSGHPHESWRRHVFARLSDEARREIELLAKESNFKVDFRAGQKAIRPPLSSHRLGGRSELLYPASVSEALDALSPTPKSLSLRMSRLIHEGDTERRYASRSEQDMAVAVAVLNAGGASTHFKTILRDPRSGVGERYRDASTASRADNYADRTWGKAEEFVRVNPRRASSVRTKRMTANRLASIDSDPKLWQGVGGARDRLLLREFVRLAAVKPDLIVGMSVRQAAEVIHGSKDAGRRALNRLSDKGFLVCVRRGGLLFGSDWRLIPPSALAETLNAQHGGGVRSECRTDCICFDLWRSPGFGIRRMRAWDLLHDSPISSSALSELLGIQNRQTHVHLARLAEYGFAVSSQGGWTRGPANPHQLAHSLGIEPLGRMSRQAHAVQRAEFRSPRNAANR